jgi:hypothetical protein
MGGDDGILPAFLFPVKKNFGCILRSNQKMRSLRGGKELTGVAPYKRMRRCRKFS